MSVLQELTSALSALGAPLETGVFTDKPPDEYIVITPMTEWAAVSGDNWPVIDVAEFRITLYTRKNYVRRKNQIIRACLDNGFTITMRRYVGFEESTGYHTYAVDAAKEFFTEVELDG